MTYLPLAGVKVLDLSRFMGPAHATMKLADFGADVVKVERPPRGDPLRGLPPVVDGRGLMHWSSDRGKRSLALDTRSDDGRATLEQLAAVADVIVDVSTPGSSARVLDFPALRAARPELVVCSITAFGLTGPLVDLPGHGLAIDALAGNAPVSHARGRPEWELGKLPISQGFELSALHAALAVTAALFGARTTGHGAWIDIAAWDAVVEMRRDALVYASATGDLFPGFGNSASRHRANYSFYETSDCKLVFLDMPDRRDWDQLCTRLGRDDLAAAFDREKESEGPTAIRDELERIIAEHPGSYWMDRFVEWGVSAGLVNSDLDVLAFEQTRARGIIEDRGTAGPPAVLGAIRWVDDGSRAGEGAPTCGAVGADTAEVLADWLGE